MLSLQPCTGSSCEASVEAHFSSVMLGLTMLGAALYWWAGPLSHSMPFRLSAGSLGFMALSVLILIFVLSRFVAPSKLCICTSGFTTGKLGMHRVLTGCHPCRITVHESGPVVMLINCSRKMCPDVVCRAIPNKRGIAAATMAVGSTFGAFVRYLFGRWLPTFEQLMHSKASTLRTPQTLARGHPCKGSIVSSELACIMPDTSNWHCA